MYTVPVSLQYLYWFKHTASALPQVKFYYWPDIHGTHARHVEYLSRMLRLRVFAKIMQSDICVFDEGKNSTGALTSNISEQAQKVNAACGVTLGRIRSLQCSSLLTVLALQELSSNQLSPY